MTTALLDITDSNLQLWRGDSHVRSPGYALLQGQQYSFGNPARAEARVRPRDINTRYWWQLNTQPLQPKLGPARHSADMVHAHLLDIYEQAGKPEELILAVSGSMQRNQLALLLGIIQECPFDAVGLVNRSVALGSLYGGAGRLFHLEVQLHQAVITELAQSDEQVELTAATPLPGCGLLQLQERLVEVIAAAFIRQTRFDPRRKAQTEQQLYDALPEALRTLGESTETNLEINGYRARINRSDLLVAGERLFNGATEVLGAQRSSDQILLDPITGLLPGLGDHFPGAEQLDNGALLQAVNRHSDQLLQREQALNFITVLPSLGERTAKAVPKPVTTASTEVVATANTSTAPTHLLKRASATPLQVAGTALSGDCELYQQGGQWLLRGTGAEAALVNGAPYQPGQVLARGDSIDCGSSLDSGEAESVSLIEVQA